MSKALCRSDARLLLSACVAMFLNLAGNQKIQVKFLCRHGSHYLHYLLYQRKVVCTLRACVRAYV